MSTKDIASKINEKYGEGSIIDLSPSAFKRKARKGISSGSIMLNIVLTGTMDVGYVFGRVVEIFGPNGSGKTTLALHAIAEAQRKGIPTAFIDMEHALDPIYAKAIGVQLTGANKMLFSQPRSAEDAFEMAYDLIDDGVKLIVFDSVAAFRTREELEGDVGDKHIALVARFMSQELKEMTAVVNDKGAVVIFLNQMRSKVGVMVGSSETTSGGEALRFYASVRMDVRAYRTDKISATSKLSDSKDAIKKEEAGTKFTVKTVKNKLYPPFQAVKLAIEYGKGIDKRVDYTKFGLHMRVVESVSDKQFVVKVGGKNKQYNFSNANKEVYKKIYTKAKERFLNDNSDG